MLLRNGARAALVCFFLRVDTQTKSKSRWRSPLLCREQTHAYLTGFVNSKVSQKSVQIFVLSRRRRAAAKRRERPNPSEKGLEARDLGAAPAAAVHQVLVAVEADRQLLWLLLCERRGCLHVRRVS